MSRIGGNSVNTVCTASPRELTAPCPERRILCAGDCVIGREYDDEWAVEVILSIFSFPCLNATLSGRIFSEEEVFGTAPCDELCGEALIFHVTEILLAL